MGCDKANRNLQAIGAIGIVLGFAELVVGGAAAGVTEYALGAWYAGLITLAFGSCLVTPGSPCMRTTCLVVG